MIREHNWSAETAKELANHFGGRVWCSVDPSDNGALIVWGAGGTPQACWSWIKTVKTTGRIVRSLARSGMPGVMVLERQFIGNNAKTSAIISRRAGVLMGAYDYAKNGAWDCVHAMPTTWQSWLRSQPGCSARECKDVKEASIKRATQDAAVARFFGTKKPEQRSGIADAYCIGQAWQERVRAIRSENFGASEQQAPAVQRQISADGVHIRFRR